MVNTLQIDQDVKQHSLNSRNPKFTLNDWHYNNSVRFSCYEAQQELACKIIDKTDQVHERTNETVKNNRDETNHCLTEKINEIEFYKQELICNRNELILKTDELSVYKNRITDSLNVLTKNAMDICKKCLSAREQRLGIDLVNDSVEKELRQEYEGIKCADYLMSQMLEQIQERIRCMKVILYKMDRDIKDKENNLQIDRHNLTLKETNLNLSIYHGKSDLETSNISMAEWKLQTKNNIDISIKEIQATKKLCSHTDHVLKQIITDLVNQKNMTDKAFKKRIKDTKEIKEKLELQHSELICQSIKMSKKIAQLEKVIAEKEGFIALAHTRLGNRCQRPSSERSYDNVEKSLMKEVSDLRKVVTQLQQKLFEAQASLRFLLKLQMQLEEDINIKTNTLKIDEVCCLTMHQSIDYHVF